MYVCAECGHELFSSRSKYEHSTPWPAFTETIHENSVSKHEERWGAYKVKAEVVSSLFLFYIYFENLKYLKKLFTPIWKIADNLLALIPSKIFIRTDLVKFCIEQLFGLSFWRHPFTAEDPLVSKWCKDTFLQICSDEETNSSTSWVAWWWIFS